MQNFIEIALNHSAELLTIEEFVRITNYPIDQLFVDKFWNTMEEDRLIYVDDKLIRWMGYEGTTFNAKQNFKKLLRPINEKYYEYTNEEYTNYVDHLVYAPAYTRCYPSFDSTHGSGRTTHLMLSPECLKIVMMELNTSKGSLVRSYYISLEMLFKGYSRYQSSYRQRENDRIIEKISAEKDLALQSKNDELARARKQIELIETQNQDLIKYKLFSEKKEFVYIISTLSDANKGLFKVGRTIDLKARIATYNTSRSPDDGMIYFYTWKCCSSKSLERRITEILSSFRYKKNREYYEIRYAALVSIIDLIATHEGEEEEVINAMIQEQLSAERNVDKQIEWFTPDEYPDLFRIEYTNPKPTKKTTKVKPLTEGDIKPVVVLVINGLSSNEIKQSDLTEKIKQGLRDAKISPNRYKVSDWKSTINEALTAHGIRVIRR